MSGSLTNNQLNMAPPSLVASTPVSLINPPTTLAPPSLVSGPVTLINPPNMVATPLTPNGNGNGLTPLPVGDSQTLTWQGGFNDDPTLAANWNPNVAPAMAANQTLVMDDGIMNLDGGNLAANELNVEGDTTQTATINLSAGGSLDLNVPAAVTTNATVNMAGGGTGVLNIFADPTSDPDINVNINNSTLDLQANMSFGFLDVNGGQASPTTNNNGTVFLQGDSHLNGTSVILNAATLTGFGSVELASSGTHPGRIDLYNPVPAGVNINVGEHTSTGANGLVFETAANSTTPGGLITLDDGFVKLRGETATSFTQTGNEFDIFNNGVKVDALDIAPAAGSLPLQVASNTNGVFIYNADPSTMPLGAGNGLGSGGGGGGGSGGGMQMALLAQVSPDALGPSLTPLPMGA